MFRVSSSIVLALSLSCQNDAEQPLPGDAQSRSDGRFGDERQPSDEHRPGDTTPGDSTLGDAPGDSALGDTAVDDFPIRAPQSHEQFCPGTDRSDPGMTLTFWDNDSVCSFEREGTRVEIYVQASPRQCENYWFMPDYEVMGAWSKIGGVVVPIAAQYDWGGNHHNDLIKLLLGDQLLVIWHSSIGFGFRACAPPDCLLVCGPGASFDDCDEWGGVTQDGCERVAGAGPPPLPAICVSVNADGSVPPLLDPWLDHGPQHPSYPLLPCPGEQDW
ncbi:hypothetical protein ACFL6C_03360 [Myxococcota bacterium]